jgi:hypothetical protein
MIRVPTTVPEFDLSTIKHDWHYWAFHNYATDMYGHSVLLLFNYDISFAACADENYGQVKTLLGDCCWHTNTGCVFPVTRINYTILLGQWTYLIIVGRKDGKLRIVQVLQSAPSWLDLWRDRIGHEAIKQRIHPVITRYITLFVRRRAR